MESAIGPTGCGRGRARGRVLRASLILMAAAVAMIGGPARAAGSPTPPTSTIEQRYHAPGPWSVTARPGFGCCDSSGARFDIWYPAQIGQSGVRHPIITWGDGTGAVPAQYAYLLSHLASWGFVVVASESSSTGSGQGILDAADYMVKLNADPSSIFHGALAVDRIGAMGHSQGAAGSINALIRSGGGIRTAVPIELPAQLWCGVFGVTCADTRSLTSGAVFFVNGSADNLSPSVQLLPWQLIGFQSNSAYYEATPPSMTKLWGTLKGPDHNDVQGQPDCASGAQACVDGVDGYLGYPTAWMMDQLQSDAGAHQAFVIGTGEMFHETTGWANQTGSVPY
jgi:hypothetical protein